MRKPTFKIETALPATAHGIAYPELRNGLLLQKIRKHTHLAVIANDDSIARANDDLYEELERRYGGGYAQAIVEGLKRAQRK